MVASGGVDIYVPFGKICHTSRWIWSVRNGKCEDRLLSGLYCTARPADTHLGGDTTYTALEHSSLKQFNTILSAFFILTYILIPIFKT